MDPIIEIRNTRPDDVPGIIALCGLVYPHSPPWTEQQLRSHLEVFPEGQLVAVEREAADVVGGIVAMAASLIVRWDDYDISATWRDMTDRGTFANHDPSGRTLYGAEIMVRPDLQGRGIGRRLYARRREIAQELRLLRIRAGARLRGYGQHADRLSPEEYTRSVVRGELTDPTLTFQLRQGFRVIAVVSGYLRDDPESRGYAAVIEWINREVATPEEYARQRRYFDERHPTPPGR